MINISKRNKIELLEQTAKTLGATVHQDNRTFSVIIPSIPFSKQTFGPYVGLDAQTVITFPQPERTVTLPPIVDDPQLRRVQRLRSIGVFKKSDKGAAILFIPKPMYREQARKHLSTANYVLARGDEGAAGTSAMKALIDRINATGTAEQRRIIRDLDLEAPRERFIYFLPKFHKPPDIDGLLKVRPIVDCRGTALAAADKVAAQFCAPLNGFMPTIAASTIDMVQAIHAVDTSGRDVTFFTADVSDLYTNVPIDEGIATVKTLLEECNIGTAEQRELVIEILRLTLNTNVFKFAEFWYRQIHGIPMGSNSAPVVADVFLFILERLLVERFKNEGLLLFKRYRDDIFAVFETPEQAKVFGDLYNALHPRIKLEVDISQTHANVLDIRVSSSKTAPFAPASTSSR